MVHEILAELVAAEVTAGVQVQVLEHASQKLDVFRRDRLRADLRESRQSSKETRRCARGQEGRR